MPWDRDVFLRPGAKVNEHHFTIGRLSDHFRGFGVERGLRNFVHFDFEQFLGARGDVQEVYGLRAIVEGGDVTAGRGEYDLGLLAHRIVYLPTSIGWGSDRFEPGLGVPDPGDAVRPRNHDSVAFAGEV